MMTLFRTAMLTAVLLAPLGCNSSSSGGTPGTKDSFTVKAPAMSTTVKQGDRQSVKLTISRGADFKHDIKFDATAPAGLKATVDPKTVTMNAPAEVSLTIEVDKTAALGEHKITVTATPEGGTATTVDVKVTVEAPKS